MVLFLAILAATGCATAGAQDVESGFYLGGAGNIQWIPGTGTWGEYEFDITASLNSENDGPVGFGWNDKVILGIKPLLGYSLNPKFALQMGYGLNISKSAQQSVKQTDGLTSYEQGLSIEWIQRNLEIVGVIHPDPDLGYFFYGGVDLVRVETRVTLYEGVEYQDYWGDLASQISAQEESDDIDATGFIIGGGFEFPNESKTTVVFVSGQYSTAKTDGPYFGTDDFKVKVGGVSLMAGVKWYLFNKQPAEEEK